METSPEHRRPEAEGAKESRCAAHGGHAAHPHRDRPADLDEPVREDDATHGDPKDEQSKIHVHSNLRAFAGSRFPGVSQ